MATIYGESSGVWMSVTSNVPVTLLRILVRIAEVFRGAIDRSICRHLYMSREARLKRLQTKSATASKICL